MCTSLFCSNIIGCTVYVHTKVQLPLQLFFSVDTWGPVLPLREKGRERERWERERDGGEKKKIQLGEAAFRLFPSHDKLRDRQGTGEGRVFHFPGVDAVRRSCTFSVGTVSPDECSSRCLALRGLPLLQDVLSALYLNLRA